MTDKQANLEEGIPEQSEEEMNSRARESTILFDECFVAFSDEFSNSLFDWREK